MGVVFTLDHLYLGIVERERERVGMNEGCFTLIIVALWGAKS